MAAVRGVFVSLGALLLIGIIFVTMLAGQERAEEQTRIELEYLQNRLALEYLDVLEKATIPRTVALYSKDALASGSPANVHALSSMVESDVISKVTEEYRDLGLPLQDLGLTSISITGWSHLDEWTIELDYDFSYFAISSPGIRWDVDGSGSLVLSVIGFEHPSFDAGDYGLISKDFWGLNTSTPHSTDCVLGGIGAYSCGSIRQICPYAYEECRP